MGWHGKGQGDNFAGQAMDWKKDRKHKVRKQNRTQKKKKDPAKKGGG